MQRHCGNSLGTPVAEALVKGLLVTDAEEKAKHPKKPNTLYPSGIGRCLRAQYYSHLFPEEADAEKLVIFETGKAVHQTVPRLLEKGGLRILEEETSLNIKNGAVALSGRVDVIVAEHRGEKILVEVKTASRIPDAPKDSHALQLQCYLNALGIDRGEVLYWCKTSGEVKSYALRRNPGAMQQVWERARRVCEAISAKRPPEKEGAENGWECLYCEHLLRCWCGEDAFPHAVDYDAAIPASALANRTARALPPGRLLLVEDAAGLKVPPSGFAGTLPCPKGYDQLRWNDAAAKALERAGIRLLA